MCKDDIEKKKTTFKESKLLIKNYDDMINMED